MDKVIEQLKELRQIRPREDWVKKNKELLLSQITAQSPKEQSSVFSYWYLVKLLFPMRFLNFVAKPVGIVTLACLMVIATGAYSVNASKGSLPGDILYPVKLTSEKVQVGLTTSQPEKTQLRLNHAEERVNEIDQIIKIETDPQKKQEKVNVAAENLTKEMITVTQELEEARNVVTERQETLDTIEVIKQVDAKTAELTEKLNQHQDELNKEGIESSTLKIDEAVASVKETGVKATEVIVEKYDQGEVEIAPQEVKDSLDKKLKEAEETLKVVDEQVKTTEEAIKKAESEGVVMDVPAVEVAPVITETPATVETAAPIATTSTEVTVDSTVAVPIEPVVVIPATTEEAQKLLAEAQEALKQGDMTNAMAKLKLVNSMTLQVKTTVESQITELATKLAEQPVVTEETVPVEIAPTTETPATPSAETPTINQ
jgi:hypothetical protein